MCSLRMEIIARRHGRSCSSPRRAQAAGWPFSPFFSETPSFSPSALMNSAQSQCPVEEVCLCQKALRLGKVLCLLIPALVVTVGGRLQHTRDSDHKPFLPIRRLPVLADTFLGSARL